MFRIVFIPAVVLLLLCPAHPEIRAVLRPNGPVKINGSLANGSTVVMEGDRIDTDQHSSAFLLLPGRMITVRAGSSVVYKNGSVVPSAAPAQGPTAATSSALARSKEDEDRKRKCISPKKPKEDKDCDEDHD
jgi:hypothetical protein